MGFFDSLSSIGSAVGGFVGGIAQSQFGQQVGGQLLNLGVSRLFDVIGLERSGSSGAPSGPLGTPVQFPIVPSLSRPRPDQLLTPQLLAEETLFFQPGGPGAAVRPGLRPALGPAAGARPALALPPPSIPATQPFGVQPGVRSIDFGGGPVAFPTTVQASFPPSPFALATGVPGFQPAGLAGSIARQIPGIVGGFLGGELLEGVVGGGGGTPMFRRTMVGARAQFFRAPNPVTGQDTWFRPAGRPILWSGDVTACRRVKKVARFARRKR